MSEPLPHEPKPGQPTITVDYATFIENVRIINAIALLARQCHDEPATINADTVLAILRTAGVNW